MWKKGQFLKIVRTKIAEFDARHKADAPTRDPASSVTYSDEREYREALLWLTGKPQRIDFKIESRFHDGRWRHSLLYGAGGYSAASKLFTVDG